MEFGVQNIFFLLDAIFFLFVSGTCNLQFSAFLEFPFTVLTTLWVWNVPSIQLKCESGSK